MARPSAFSSEVPQEPERQLQLVVHAGPLAGKGFPLTKEVLTFGRDPDNDITLDDSQVSRHHAQLVRKGNEVIIEDLNSTNGTKINGKPIAGQQVLQPADIISIGSSVFGVKGFAAPSNLGVTQIARDAAMYASPPMTPAAPPSSPPSSAAASPPAAAPPVRRPASLPAQPQARPTRLTFLAVGGSIALIITVLVVAGLTVYFFNQSGTSVADIPTVVITAPGDNSQVPVNQPVTVQAIGSDPTGVRRMELWVRGLKMSEAVSPAPQGQPTLTASFQWTPEASGSYTLEVRAYNQREAVSIPTTVTIDVVGEDADEPTATPSATPEPIETVPGNPLLTTRTDLNVRGGPGIEYDLLGLLPAGTDAEIIGRDQALQWWQIRFNPAADGRGWVAADPTFSTTANVGNVPVVQPPPTPTLTPTSTSIPPTETPTGTPVINTATPVPATDTPVPSPTSPGNQVFIDFNVDPRVINGGDCVTITWNVSGVREVYLNGNGIEGSGTVKDCPTENTVYRLRVVKVDGTEQIQEIQVDVVNRVSIKSSGNITIRPNETIDIDDGDIPGDDFIWDVNDNEGTFEVQGGVELATFPPIGSLNDISRSECVGATYGVYSYIYSELSPDRSNSLIDGRAICFKTNKGRLGKLRFPQRSTDRLKIEWVTWQK